MIIIILNLGCHTNESGSDDKYEKHFDFKLSVEPREQYKGAVFGSLNLIKIEITNLTDKEYQVGNYFRVLMSLDESAWNQFAMAVSGPTKLTSKKLAAAIRESLSNDQIKQNAKNTSDRIKQQDGLELTVTEILKSVD